MLPYCGRTLLEGLVRDLQVLIRLTAFPYQQPLCPSWCRSWCKRLLHGGNVVNGVCERRCSNFSPSESTPNVTKARRGFKPLQLWWSSCRVCLTLQLFNYDRASFGVGKGELVLQDVWSSVCHSSCDHDVRGKEEPPTHSTPPAVFQLLW